MAGSLDLLLVGGGLANGLAAWRLAETQPELRFTVLEAGPTLGGDHTWSFHGTDVTPAQLEWLRPLVSASWPAHDVTFGPEVRRIGSSYHSIRSTDFHARLAARLGDRLRLGARAKEVSATRVVLESGEMLEAQAVLDGRGFASAPAWRCGFQKFLGLDVRFERPHGVEVPLLMDGRVDQEGGFRFLYLLPWDAKTLLVEDTVYADDAAIDRPRFRARIEAYLTQHGFPPWTVEREEAAALPIPLAGDAPLVERPTTGVAAGLFHATTGYSLPMAVEVADALAARESFDAPALTRWLAGHARAHWRQQGFFRMLNRMLFLGAEPAERVRVFASFYRHTSPLIGRFYAGRLTAMDKLKVLARGAPTVPGPRAMRAALG